MQDLQIVTNITYSSSNDLQTIMDTLNGLPDLIACDFETAPRWTDVEKEALKEKLANPEGMSVEDIRLIQQAISSTGLSHPSLTYITHFSVAWSETESFVAILDTDLLRLSVLNWLVTTTKRQIWHNFSFDGKLIHYYTKKLPINYDDTEILSRCLLNHVQTDEAKSGLKFLMGYRYGDWAVAKDHFNLDSIYNESLIHYAGIDSCATFALYGEIVRSVYATA